MTETSNPLRIKNYLRNSPDPDLIRNLNVLARAFLQFVKLAVYTFLVPISLLLI